MDFNSFLGYAQINLNSSLLYCVVWEGVFGGGLSQFSWGWENRVSCTVLLGPLSRLSILKQREQAAGPENETTVLVGGISGLYFM